MEIVGYCCSPYPIALQNPGKSHSNTILHKPTSKLNLAASTAPNKLHAVVGTWNNVTARPKLRMASRIPLHASRFYWLLLALYATSIN